MRLRHWIMLGLAVMGGLPLPHVHAATYYVATGGNDAAPGTEAQPFQTINRAVKAMAGGDRVLIHGGTYSEDLIFTVGELPSGLGSWDTATTIAGYPGEHVIVKPPAEWPANQFGVLYLGADRDGNPVSWVIVDNLELDLTNNPPGPGTSAVVTFAHHEVHHIRLSHLDIHGGNHNVGGAGGFVEVIQSKIHDGRSYGFYWTGHHSLFADNEVYNMGGVAYHIYNTGADNVSYNIVRNNRISNNGHGTAARGAPSGGNVISHGTGNAMHHNLIYNNYHGIQVDLECIDCVVACNTIVGNRFQGLSIGERSTHAIVKNNIVYGNGAAIAHAGDPTAEVHHNYTDPDPLFVNADAGDFHLRPSSPALRASDTGGEVGAYCPSGGPSPGTGTPAPAPPPALQAPRNLKVISLTP